MGRKISNDFPSFRPSQEKAAEKLPPMLEKLSTRLSPAVEYSKDGKHMLVKTPIPKEVLDRCTVTVDGGTVTVQYGHSEEHKTEHTHSRRSYASSWSQSTGRRIKSYDTRVEGENTLLVDVVFEDDSKP